MKPILTEEERTHLIEVTKLTQEIINCDNWITKLEGDFILQFNWKRKKREAEKKLKELTEKKL